MAVGLQGLLAPISLLRLASIEGATVVELDQGLGFVPFTKLFQMAYHIPNYPLTYGNSKQLPESTSMLCRKASSTGKLAYIESIHFGDINPEACALWVQGVMVEQLIALREPVNRALRFVGAHYPKGEDEIIASGLVKQRVNLQTFAEEDGA
jgi:hypothetical protein